MWNIIQYAQNYIYKYKKKKRHNNNNSPKHDLAQMPVYS